MSYFVRSVLYGGGPGLLVGLAVFAEIPISVNLFFKICFRLYERRACPTWRYLAIDYRDLA